MKDRIQIHPKDNVEVQVTEDGSIPRGHKVALTDIQSGEKLFKYGFPIAKASCDIAKGEHVHTHNAQSLLDENHDYASVQRKEREELGEGTTATFEGYRRKNGRVAIRNEIWIINTVGCVNKIAERLSRMAEKKWGGTDGLDGIFTFSHPYGCSQLGGDIENTQALLSGLIHHPHAAGVLIIGLGCENNRIQEQLSKSDCSYDEERIRYFNAQQVEDELEHGMQELELLVNYAKTFNKETLPLSDLVIGMKCGGSDGFSGITANPLVGRITDRHCSSGGTSILTEVPEVFGAEIPLLERTQSETVMTLFTAMVNRFKDYFRQHDQPIYENPSPGNKDGGITTLEEKSLGCIQKGGHSPINEVLHYGAQASTSNGGISWVNAPGNDGVSGSALTAAGANIILFTTGRGTPMGFPVPTLKIASNSALASKKSRWIDFNAGELLEDQDLDTLSNALWEKIVDTANGHYEAKNERNDFKEISIWKTGVTL